MIAFIKPTASLVEKAELVLQLEKEFHTHVDLLLLVQ